MAIYTSEADHFVLNESNALFLNGFMTFFARDIFMRPVQFKSSLIVIKFAGSPIVKSMAFFAIRDSITFKLAEMDILVAGGAVHRRQVKLNMFFIVGFCRVDVTGTAGLNQMFPF